MANRYYCITVLQPRGDTTTLKEIKHKVRKLIGSSPNMSQYIDHNGYIRTKVEYTKSARAIKVWKKLRDRWNSLGLISLTLGRYEEVF
jgi:hypothetical protein